MIQALFMNLLLSYLSFDIPTESRVLLLSRDHTGLYAVASPYLEEVDGITVSINDDEECDCEKQVVMEEIFDTVPFDGSNIIREEDGDLLIKLPEEEIPDFLIEGEDGFLYYLKKKS